MKLGNLRVHKAGLTAFHLLGYEEETIVNGVKCCRKSGFTAVPYPFYY
jgi:hypothetical protein